LPREERRLLWPGLGYVLIARISLALFGLKRTLRLLDGQAGEGGRNADWEAPARAIVRAGSRVPGVRCLARAIALRWWMRRAGEPAELIIGMNPGAQGQPDMHAWVQSLGTTWDWPRDKPTGYRIVSRDNRPVTDRDRAVPPLA